MTWYQISRSKLDYNINELHKIIDSLNVVGNHALAETLNLKVGNLEQLAKDMDEEYSRLNSLVRKTIREKVELEDRYEAYLSEQKSRFRKKLREIEEEL